MSDGRNLVVCCDGTSNQFGDTNTNVVRLVQTLEQDPASQLVFYDPGVGTLPEPGLFSKPAQTLSRWMGLAFGWGLIRNVEEAYAFLMETWRPGDRVFLFGFSRGAYTVRVLAGLLRQMGLLSPGQRQLIPYAIRLYRASPHPGDQDDERYWRVSGEFRQTFARPIPGQDTRQFPVHFVGVWDTVSSVGWVWNPKAFVHTARNAGIATVRHAVSLDERRAFFRQNLFRPEGPRPDRLGTPAGPRQDLVERWFGGVHADIGGGYDKTRGALWRVAFDWMVAEARAAGLRFDERALRELEPRPAEPWSEPLNRSLTWHWWLAEVFPKLSYSARWKRRLPALGLFGHRRTAGAVLHESVLRRIRQDKGYRPRNLPPDVIARIQALPDVRPGDTFTVP